MDFHLDADLTGEVVGGEHQLLLEERIGAGGAGVIWRARDLERQRDVAVKFLRSESPSREQRERFRREGQRFGKIRHPNLVRVYWLGQHRGLLYLALEFVDGMDLYEHLSEAGAFSVRDGLAICGAIASGLTAAHRQQVIHRDLKPSNIMIRDVDGMVKVLDFGIAKDLSASSQITKIGIFVGTPAYSAPEQIRGDPVDARTDVFSLGVILYEVLTGLANFGNRHSTEIMRATLKQERVQLRPLYDRVAGPVARLVHRMTRADPARRPGSMDEIVEECGRLMRLVDQEHLDAEDAKTVTGMLKTALTEDEALEE